MIPVRLRHPRGVTTLEIEPEDQTIEDLKILIFSSTEIPPHEQEIKFGYPPKLLPQTTAVLASIPITRGEQLIVTSVPSNSAPIAPPPTLTPAPPIKALDNAISAPAPPSASTSRAESPLATNDIPVESVESVPLPGRDAGYMQLRVVPDDNSCLFSSIGIAFEGGIEAAQRLRQIVADAIRENPDEYPDVVLGRPREEYIRTILKPDTWGGAIEISIFASHYKTEISSFDVATGRCDRFGEGQYDSRCVLVYSGIHYDVISVSPLPVSPPSFHTTIFPISDTTILPTASKLVDRLRARHYYTDTATFDLQCDVCGVGLKGEKGAREHAMRTGHVAFGEYRAQ